MFTMNLRSAAGDK